MRGAVFCFGMHDMTLMSGMLHACVLGVIHFWLTGMFGMVVRIVLIRCVHSYPIDSFCYYLDTFPLRTLTLLSVLVLISINSQQVDIPADLAWQWST